MKLISSIVILLLVSVFAATVAMSNSGAVSIKYYFGFEKEVPIYLLITAPFVAGLIVGVAIMSISVMRNKMKVGKTKRELSKVEKEVQNLRSAPITEPMKDEIQS